MSGTILSSHALDPRRRRILFRAWHRGTREMDLLMGGFCDAALPGLDEAELGAIEALIEASDHDMYEWLTGASAVPRDYDTPLFSRLKAFHTHLGPRFA